MLTDGIIIIDKPENITSYDCIRKIKRAYPKHYKIGHCGTLDPFASGLLIILIGKATKLQSLLMTSQKQYTGIIKLGIKTDTGDITGKIINNLSYDKNKLNLTGLVNYTYNQIPPSYSAKKINGQKAYDLARKGQEVTLKPVPVTIYNYQLQLMSSNEVSFIADVSKGTYIRTLNEDYFAKQNILATTTKLRRLASGKFNLTSFLPNEEINLVELGEILNFKKIFINKDQVTSVLHANELILKNETDDFLLVYYNDLLLAYYTKGNNKKYKPLILLNENN